MKKSFLILTLISVGHWANGQTDSPEILEIREYFNYVNNHLSSFNKTKEETFEESTEGGMIFKYSERTSIVKISMEFLGETGQLHRDYYLKNDKLVFVFDEELRYNMPHILDSIKATEMGFSEWFDPEKTKMFENRCYFNQGKMIKWIDSAEIVRDIDQAEFKDKEKFYLDDLKKYK